MSKKFLLLDLLGIIVIVAAFFIEKIDLSNISIEYFLNIRLSGVYNFFFMLWYIILHSIRYAHVDELDESGIYHVREYWGDNLQREYDEYQKHTGWYMGISYLVFHLILILFHNSILGFLITYGAILIRDFFAYLARNHFKGGIIGVVLSSIIWLVVFIYCMINAFDSQFDNFSMYFYYTILPCVSFCIYIICCTVMCDKAYDKNFLYDFYLVNSYIVGVISVILAILLFENLL